jgi:hypothetical protein
MIPDARIVPVPGPDHSPFVGADVTNEVERFLGSPHEAVVADRVLATVLFTDLVASTERIASLGDRQWRELLETHHRGVRRELALYGGVEIDRRVTDSSAASTVRRAQSLARSKSWTTLVSWTRGTRRSPHGRVRDRWSKNRRDRRRDRGSHLCAR